MQFEKIICGILFFMHEKNPLSLQLSAIQGILFHIYPSIYAPTYRDKISIATSLRFRRVSIANFSM